MKTIHAIFRNALAVALVMLAAAAQADAVTDWNTKANELIVSGRVGPPPANRALAVAHVAVFEAVNAITGRYAPGALVDAAVAAAMRGTLGKLLAPQQLEIDALYELTLAKLPEDAARSAGVAIGEKAAAAVLAWRGTDGAAAPDSYLPFTQPGVYVPTVSPAVPHWGRRKPWVLASGDQLRPGPPPALTSELWARDYNEIKALGGRNSTQRSAVQTEIARFWEAPARHLLPAGACGGLAAGP